MHVSVGPIKFSEHLLLTACIGPDAHK